MKKVKSFFQTVVSKVKSLFNNLFNRKHNALVAKSKSDFEEFEEFLEQNSNDFDHTYPLWGSPVREDALSSECEAPAASTPKRKKKSSKKPKKAPKAAKKKGKK